MQEYVVDNISTLINPTKDIFKIQTLQCSIRSSIREQKLSPPIRCKRRNVPVSLTLPNAFFNSLLLQTHFIFDSLIQGISDFTLIQLHLWSLVSMFSVPKQSWLLRFPRLDGSMTEIPLVNYKFCLFMNIFYFAMLVFLYFFMKKYLPLSLVHS